MLICYRMLLCYVIFVIMCYMLCVCVKHCRLLQWHLCGSFSSQQVTSARHWTGCWRRHTATCHSTCGCRCSHWSYFCWSCPCSSCLVTGSVAGCGTSSLIVPLSRCGSEYKSWSRKDSRCTKRDNTCRDNWRTSSENTAFVSVNCRFTYLLHARFGVLLPSSVLPTHVTGALHTTLGLTEVTHLPEENLCFSEISYAEQIPITSFLWNKFSVLVPYQLTEYQLFSACWTFAVTLHYITAGATTFICCVKVDTFWPSWVSGCPSCWLADVGYFMEQACYSAESHRLSTAYVS